MRFFLASKPADRLEYIAIMVVTGAVMAWLTTSYLGFGFDPETSAVSYIGRNLSTFMLLATALTAVQIINTMRRLVDIKKPTWLAFLLLVPVLGLVMTLALMVIKRPSHLSFKKFGDEAVSSDGATNAWGEAVLTYQGAAVRLPGDDQREQAA